MAQLLSNLPVGTRVKFGKYSVNGETALPITWLIVAKNHGGDPSYPTNSVTLLTEKAIDLRCYDAREIGSGMVNRAEEGNNRYGVSNIDQWLNKDSSGGSWYVPTHSDDHAPDAEAISYPYLSAYVDRPGFLNAFSNDEKGVILDTLLRYYKTDYDGGETEEITRKVFLPSTTEILGTVTSSYTGLRWEYFANNPDIKCSLTAQAYVNTLTTKPVTANDPCTWWLRNSPSGAEVSEASYVSTKGEILNMSAYASSCGVRPALNVASTTLISDTIDSDGCYVTAFNSAPLAPNSINPPSTIYGGKSNAISWTKAIDPDGDTVSYQLERSINGGSYEQIYKGDALSYAHLVPFGASTVSYRVKAIDPSGESSAYTTSDTINIINNNAPAISGSDSNLGVKSAGFTGTYTITDANSDTVTVTEAIDGVRIRSLVATLGEEITYGVTEDTWLALPNGSHTLTISATDGIDTTVRTIVFTKLVDTLKIQNSTPWVSSTMPSRIMLVITRNIPSAATFKVEVCNNGYDASPKWEDATDAVRSGLVHVFSNAKKTATNWGVLVRVTVARNGATGACYISAIGGNFE